ncbi:Hypothetical protein POVR1_LOCUS65 [uncultured virus]|nr:Hypothetical protein POVR1_LOCUS65 [uncultured virus]
MEYLIQPDLLRNILLQLDQVDIKKLCTQLMGRCEQILEDQSFWKEKLHGEGINSRAVTSTITDYQKVYHLIMSYPDHEKLFLQALQDQNYDLAKVLIESGEIINLCQALKIAIQNHSLELFNYLLEFQLSPCDWTSILLTAATAGNLSIVNQLIPMVNLGKNDNIFVVSFLSMGIKSRTSPFPNPRPNHYKAIPNFSDIALKFLDSETINLQSSTLLYYSILTGDSRIILKLLKQYKIERINQLLGVDNHLLVRLATEDRLNDVLDLLLFDPFFESIDPSAAKNEAINRAAYHGFYEIVESLLTCELVRRDQIGLRKAYNMTKDDSIKRLIGSYWD